MLGPRLKAGGRTEVIADGQRLVSFSGCDYFRLSSHPLVLRAADETLKKEGLNVAASRSTTGNHPLYEELESELSKFFGVERAVLTSSGYTSNLVAAQALAGEFRAVLIDERAHPSLRDAARFFDAPLMAFKHRDPAAARELIGGRDRVVLLTDGVFAYDGGMAPLVAYDQLLPPDSLLVVDDAHGMGVVGPTGRGSLEGAELTTRVLQTGTLSKAFGAYGGVILGSEVVLARILERSPGLAGSTPIPLPLAAAALRSLRLLREDNAMLSRLRANSGLVKAAARLSGLILPESEAPVIGWSSGTGEGNMAAARRLEAAGIYPPLMKYFGGPGEGFFRFAISSEHTAEELDLLLQAMNWSRS